MIKPLLSRLFGDFVQDKERSSERIIMFVVAAALFMEFMDISIINTAIPRHR